MMCAISLFFTDMSNFFVKVDVDKIVKFTEELNSLPLESKLSMKTKFGITLVTAIASCLVSSFAQTASWNGSTTNWGLGSAWSTGAVPTSATDIEFGNYAGSGPSTGNSFRPAQNVSFTRTTATVIVTLSSDGGLNAAGTVSTVSGASEVFLRSTGSLSAANLTVNSALNLGSRSASGATGSIGNIAISGTTSVNSGGTLYVGGLAGTANLGSLSMGGGTFNLIAGSNLANGTADGATNAITVSRLNGSTGTITGAKNGATVTTTGHLTVSGTVNGDFGGTISDGLTNNRVQLTKAGSSTLTLSGSNSYTGATTVNAGTLIIAGSLGNTAVAVGNTAVLGGSGTIGGAVTVNSGGRIAPGTSPGRLTVTNSVMIADGGSSAFELNGATVATQYDQIRMTGVGSTFSLTGTNNLVLSLGFTPATNALFFLVDNQSSNGIGGVFEQLNGVTTSLGQGDLFTVGVQQFKISYVGDVTNGTFTGGNDIVLQAVPEPAAWALFAGGLATVMLLRRRRTS